MPRFRFAVRSKEGRIRTGGVTEAGLEQARQRLVDAGYEVISLTGESDIVVHDEKTERASGTSVKSERAAIIEFETTIGERIGDFFSKFILRKEAMAAFLLVGIALAVYTYASKPKVEPVPEAKYTDFKIVISVDSGSFSGEAYQVLLPDIPLRFNSKTKDGAVLVYSFEAIKQPRKVQVSLVDHGELVARGESTFSSRDGQLAASVILDSVKTKSK